MSDEPDLAKHRAHPSSKPTEQPGSPADPTPVRDDSSLALLLAAPVAGAIFGSSAFQLGGWTVCLFARNGCTPLASAEGGLMAVALGFIITTVIGAEVARRKNKGADAVVIGVVVTIIAGFFTAFRALAGPNGLPDVRTLQFAFFVLIVGILFVLPIVVRPFGPHRWAELRALYGRMAMAALVAGTIALLFSGLARLIPQGDVAGADLGFYAPPHPNFFLVRPAGVGLLIAPWIILAYDPAFTRDIWCGRSRREAIIWTAGFWILAAVLLVAYVYLFYWPRHHSGRLADAGFTLAATTAIFAGLLLAPLAAAGISLGLSRGRFTVSTFRSPPGWLGLVVAAVGGAVVGVALLRIGAQTQPALLFAAFHVVTAIVTWAVGLTCGSYGRDPQ